MSPLIIVYSLVANPWADGVLQFDEGIGGSPGYNIAESVLGEPSRFTGEDIWPGVVSPFNAPWLAEEIVSIGSGGSIVITFDEHIENHPNNPWGVDFIMFGNTGFIDNAYPTGIVGGVFSDDGGLIEVSQLVAILIANHTTMLREYSPQISQCPLTLGLLLMM
jgi:hypothetical protein